MVPVWFTFSVSRYSALKTLSHTHTAPSGLLFQLS